ncbi:MAG TPA: membrane protein insertase YidC [Atopostipes sp.]|nr:membrane protein insertase YidC [Atopostipes sp.]
MKNVKTRKLNTKIKKYMLTGTLLSAVLFLSGCMRFDQETGAPQGFLSEIVYDFLIIPLDQFLNFLGEFLGNYGLAIIVFTLLFRLILLPLTLRQQKGTIESQIKMSAIQPVTQEIQAELKATDDPQEQQALNMELMEIYRENDVNIGGQLSAGCLPLLLQMPIFVAMFQVLRRSNEIANASFMGMELGERSIILAVITGAIYLLQSRMMIKNMPEEQQATAGTTMYITPVMMFMFAVSGPAGIGLYWLVSGVFTIGQQLFNQLYYKPRIEANVREKLGPVKKIERKRRVRRDVTPTNEADSTIASNEDRNRNRNRNAGKQQRNRRNNE